jgi:hypothetical protein
MRALLHGRGPLLLFLPGTGSTWRKPTSGFARMRGLHGRKTQTLCVTLRLGCGRLNFRSKLMRAGDSECARAQR